jgi:arsenite-transporting ATPase
MNGTILDTLLTAPTRFLFFTGKGGVGKTSLSCAVAIALADAGKRVLLVSTDPASNLDEMLATKLGNIPKPVVGVSNLFALNIDPETAADAYRSRVLAQLPTSTSPQERQGVIEQLSGACTTEIAAFDEFAGLLAGEADGYDHVVFDTAPTGHTLRLLSLPKAWSGFLEDNDRGASCLGPHSGLKMQEHRFNEAFGSLSDPTETTVVLVTRPEASAIREAARTSVEIKVLGLSNQLLAINGVFIAARPADEIAIALENVGAKAIDQMPEELASLPRLQIPLRAFDMVGLPALRALLQPALEENQGSGQGNKSSAPDVPGLRELIDQLSERGRGLVMVMGKGGVGKTTVAAALAIGLVKRGHQVHLTTTDPAAHVAATVADSMPGLRVDRIDPQAETRNYIDKIMATRGAHLDDQGRALLLEDLQSPCTEEVAVFHAFSKTVAEARAAYVVLDTAPTGHTLLLMDATGAYHRQMLHDVAASGSPARAVTPLMRLQDPEYTQIILVTLPETTPVSEAASLQDDLRRASIEPYAWVVNRSLAGTGTRDPLLMKRIEAELAQIERVRSSLAKRVFLIRLQAAPPIGLTALVRISGDAQS